MTRQRKKATSLGVKAKRTARRGAHLIARLPPGEPPLVADAGPPYGNERWRDADRRGDDAGRDQARSAVPEPADAERDKPAPGVSARG